MLGGYGSGFSAVISVVSASAGPDRIARLIYFNYIIIYEQGDFMKSIPKPVRKALKKVSTAKRKNDPTEELTMLHKYMGKSGSPYIPGKQERKKDSEKTKNTAKSVLKRGGSVKLPYPSERRVSIKRKG